MMNHLIFGMPENKNNLLPLASPEVLQLGQSWREANRALTFNHQLSGIIGGLAHLGKHPQRLLILACRTLAYKKKKKRRYS